MTNTLLTSLNFLQPLVGSAEYLFCYFTAGIAAFIFVFGFIGVPLIAWILLIAIFLSGVGAGPIVWFGFLFLAVLFNVKPLRQVFVSSLVLKFFKVIELLPKISETEMTAIKSGTVWMEGELFSGKPHFKTLMEQKTPVLTAEEQGFLDGPVEEVCKMVHDWTIQQTHDLPEEVWAYIKKNKFLGMIIPKEYGGLGFSAFAHGEVISKLASRSGTLAITVMVPNSLGPAELLNHYGTDEQKRHYLPRLATGEEIPCFALTEPNAGSDAGSIHSHGEVFKGADGKLYIRLNWNKRWITLAAASTLLGLAFRLNDPELLLGLGKVDLGITCALIPSNTPGVITKRRHDPMGVPFINSPTHGVDVVVPLDAIIGGPVMAGQGWMMLMECLAAGRGISLPSVAVATGKYCSRVVGAYATVRKQFGMSVGRFEGVEEGIARIVGFNYLMEASKKYTLGAIDRGSKPPVVTAICKYYFTELQRKLVNDSMDILGGSGISRGPRNLMANLYQAIPISITVEGANILTRTLIIFGQGALRAHPYAYKEVEALANDDTKAFDRAFFGHVGHVIRNAFRASLLGLTRGGLILPYRGGVTAKYYRKLGWSSALFAILADYAMGSLGGGLKARGKITGRFADILGWMYMVTATLKRFEEEGRKKEDEPILKWSLEYAFHEIQIAFEGLLGGPFKWLMKANPIGCAPKDQLDFAVSRMIQTPGSQRDRLTAGIFNSKKQLEHPFQLEQAFLATVESDQIDSKIRTAVKKKIIDRRPANTLANRAMQKGVITAQELEKLAHAEELRDATIQVDDFGLEDFRHGFPQAVADFEAAERG